MKCSSCQVESPSDAEFCPDCGASLLVPCPQCPTSDSAGSRFCKKCGQALDAARPVFKLDDPGRDVRLLLPALHVPTLVLHGGHDRVNPVEAARWAAEQVPGAQFHTLEGRSHMLVATAVVEFAQVVRSFIRTGRPA